MVLLLLVLLRLLRLLLHRLHWRGCQEWQARQQCTRRLRMRMGRELPRGLLRSRRLFGRAQGQPRTLHNDRRVG